jgi:hypothetical protein
MSAVGDGGSLNDLRISIPLVARQSASALAVFKTCAQIAVTCTNRLVDTSWARICHGSHILVCAVRDASQRLLWGHHRSASG